MHTFNFWHKFDLSGRKIILLIILLGSGLPARTQYVEDKPVIHNPNYDDRRFITYGFSIGLHTSGLQLKYSDAFADDLDSLHSITALTGRQVFHWGLS